MKKALAHIGRALVLVSMLALLGGCNEEKQPQKPAPQFGVVQLSKLYQESRIGKAGFERLTALEAKAQNMLKDSVVALEKARAEGKEDEAMRIEQDLQDRVAFMQNVIRQDQEHVGNVIQTALKNAFDKYSKEHGLFGVFSTDTMLSSSPEVDVTAAIQTMMDSVVPAFGDLPSLDLPKLPEPANALPAEGAAAEEKAPEAPAAAPAEAPAK